MATSSPYSGNDYSVFNARPNNLPVNDILKAFVSKNEYWKLGAEQVKNRYDGILDLDLSKEENRQIRDNFIEKSQKDLASLASKDLSDPEVKKAGIKLFDPLLKDEGILYDDQATKHYKKVLSDADTYRNQDGGKYYNQDNVVYALDGWDDFLNSKDRTAGKQFLRKAKEYTPYYDFHGEIPAIMKECKPSSASSDALNGMYIDHSSIEARTASQVTGCLDAGLSPKAKQQIGIHGYAAYKNNPEALRDSYLPLVSGQAQNLSQENARIAGILANKDKLAKMKPEELKKMGITPNMINPEYIKGLEAQQNDNSLRLDNLHKTMSQLSTGDLSPISGDKFETVAGAVYAKDYLQNYGRGFEYSKEDHGKKGDNVQLQILHENRTDARQEDNQNFQIKKLGAEQNFDLKMQKDDQQFKLGLEAMKSEMELKKAMLKSGSLNIKGVLTGNDIEDARHFNPAFEDNTETSSYQKLTDRLGAIAHEKGDLNARAVSQFSNIPGFPKGKTPKDPEFQEWYKTYTQTLPKDDPMWKVIIPYEKTMHSLAAEETIIKNDQVDIDNEINKHAANLLDRSYLKQYKPISFAGQQVKPEDVANLIEGKPSNLRINSNKYVGQWAIELPNGHEIARMSGPTVQVVGGKRLPPDLELLNSNSGDFSNLYNSIYHRQKGVMSDLNKKRDEIAKDKTTIQTEGYGFSQLNDDDSPFKQRIAQRLGASDNINKINIGDTDLKGNFEITISADSKDKDFQSTTIKNLKTKFADNIREVKGSPNSFIVSGFNNFNIIDKSRLSNVYDPLLRGLEKRTGLNNPKSTGLIRAVDPRYQYGVEVQPGLTEGSYSYRIYNNKNETKDILYDRKEALRMLELHLDPNTK